MHIVEILPFIAGGIVFAVAILVAMMAGGKQPKNIWMLPGIFAALFVGWTVYAIVVEGPLGFWPEHTRNLWGNQIWFDLLFGIGIAWAFLAPRAKALGMRLLPWLAFILSTGSIGLLTMFSRFLYLQERANAVPGR